MAINKLPTEILEEIIIEAAKLGSFKDSLKKYALVNRKWALIANPLIWKEVYITSKSAYRKGNEISFYSHIRKRGYVCGKYIQKLVLKSSKRLPTQIIKILCACPNITDLTINYYSYDKSKGHVDNFLKKVEILLPRLIKLNLEYNRYQMTNIEEFIERRKDLHIIATRNCKKHPYLFDSYTEKYDGKEWKGCYACIHEHEEWFINCHPRIN